MPDKAATQRQPPTTTSNTEPKATSGLLPPIFAITTLQESNARTLAHVHNVLLPLIYVAGFQSIVVDPVSALSALLIPIGILQSVYCAVCLPPSSGSASVEKAKKKLGAPQGKGGHWTQRIIPSLISIASALLLAPPPLFALLVAHGAPLTTHHAHTGLLALHVSMLASPALFYTRGLGAENWRQIISMSAPLDECLGAALGTLFGCWLGAIPIPLDWDREWQKWPVTICTGAYLGWTFGKLLGGTVAWGRTINFE